MDRKLWLMLMAMSAIISLSKQLDLSSLMGLSGTAKEESLKAQLPNKNDNIHLPNKSGFQMGQDKFEKFDNFDKNKTGFDNNKNGLKTENQVVYIATPPTIDDGNSSHFQYNSQQSYGSNQNGNAQYGTGLNGGTQFRRPGQNYHGNNKPNLTGYDAYRQMFGYNQGPNRRPDSFGNRPVAHPVYTQRPVQHQQQQNQYQQQPRPQQPQQYQQQQNRPQQQYQRPQQQPHYGSGTQQHSYTDQQRQYGNVQPHSSPINYGNTGHSYSSSYSPVHSYSGPSNVPTYGNSYQEPVYDHIYDNSYIGSSYPEPDPIDYSKYIPTIPYQEVSEYMSPAQYNDYNERIYQTYRVPVPKYQNSNYTSKYNTTNDFKMSIAVVVLNSHTQGNNEHNKFGQNKFGQNNNFGQNKFGSNKFNTRSVGDEEGQDYQQDQRSSFPGFGGGLDQKTDLLSSKTDFQDKFQNNFDKQGFKQGQRHVRGTLFITEIYPQVCIVSGVVTGLEASRKFGIAIYEIGDLTNGCLSIGNHYNPYHRNHGNINSEQSHIGDLGNIDADQNGVAHVNKISRFQFSVQSKNPVAGRSIGICSNSDDLGKGGTVDSLKNGNCGPIQACGVIGLSNTGGSESGHI